jgi:hypothetical protein
MVRVRIRLREKQKRGDNASNGSMCRRDGGSGGREKGEGVEGGLSLVLGTSIPKQEQKAELNAHNPCNIPKLSAASAALFCLVLRDHSRVDAPRASARA